MNDINKDHVLGKALANKPFTIDNINIYTPLLTDIIEIGEEIYYQYLNFFCIDVDKEINQLNEKQGVGLTSFNLYDILEMGLYKDPRTKEELDNAKVKNTINMLKFFLCRENEEISIQQINNTIFFLINDKQINELNINKIIHRNNFGKIVEIIKIQNDVDKIEKQEDDFNPANDKAKKFKERLDKIKAKKNKLKAKSCPSLKDKISILSSKSINLDIIKIWKLNIYQLNNQLNRLFINENYDIQKYLLSNSFASSSVDLEKNHYFVKIKNNT